MFGLRPGQAVGMPLSQAYGNHENMINKEIKIEDYLLYRGGKQVSLIENLSLATMPMFDNKGFIGNCFSIAKDFVLTSGHCVSADTAYIGNAVKKVIYLGKVVFDGSSAGLDFKILWVEGGDFKPMTLDVDNDVGNSVQLYFKESFPPLDYQKYLRFFESFRSQYAIRSNTASSQTNAGESGAPRMSLWTGNVHAIHQGESEGLPMNAIYDVLERAANSDLDSRKEIAERIISVITVANLSFRGLAWSSLVIKQRDVAEEKPRASGDVSFFITENRKQKQVIFHYSEEGHGKGNRKITIHKKGTESSVMTYAIFPNPHENHKYNVNGGNAKEFYEILTRKIGEFYLQNGKYPSTSVIKVWKEDYTLSISTD